MTARVGDVSRDGGMVFLSLSGEIDINNAAEVGDAILAPVTNDDVGVVADVGRLSYLDSSGVAMLFGVVRKLEGRGKSLGIVLPASSRVRSVLTVTGAGAVITIAETRDEAAKGVRAAVERLFR